YSGFQTIIFSRFGVLFGVASLGFAVRHLFNISNLFGFVNYFFHLFGIFFRFVCNPCVVSVVVITIFWILALCSCVFDLAELMGIFLGNYLGNYYGRG
ncbi:MAG: hypothetical protein ACKPKC_03640, partial [Dolichospermum sp.]